MRQLASIQRVLAVYPIEGADNIETVQINGWQVIQKKGESKVGDLVVYFEIDSLLPVRPEYEFLRASSYKKLEGHFEGFRIKTRKLRGVISQGLVLPIKDYIGEYTEGEDVTELLGVQKYEIPEDVHMPQGTRSKGNFPVFIRKTDQTRVQNLPRVFGDTEARYEVTLKLDGSSMTVYHMDGHVGVCSRNLELEAENPENGNHFVKTAFKTGLVDALKAFGRNLAIQGELMGPGIQGNREGLEEHTYFVYDIFDIDKQQYLGCEFRKLIFNILNANCNFTLEHVPVLSEGHTLEEMALSNQTAMLEAVDSTPSIKHKTAEGVVFKRMDGGFSFKCISNKYLLKCEL